LHGGRWFAGTLAGLRADAVVAHATTNATLAVYVLVSHQWQLW
jgi:hypothetical protein